ncbi:MAG: phosphate ABC transporter ATP-binding protein [Bdellovibrionales bacterium CG10_big_fil_rev_8_21_14_0_10_45_34]|nr:MAG: phosphate ABC transporter ATP-binding protein [Bdellovibrionales bacterium CG10_big_fil_rev_8_21_14_0_10_45_34]
MAGLTNSENQNPPVEPLLSVDKLSAWFGKQQALFDVSLNVSRHTVLALIGPSGCGKSTFIRCLNRLHEEVPGARSEGVVKLNGQNIYGATVDPVKVRRQIGMVFQKPNPFPGMSIFDNVAVGLRLAGTRKRSILADQVEQALEQAALFKEVKDKLKAPGTSLSGGQQQRLCIARTLAVRPPIILMDEPTSALDPISTARIEELVIELKRNVTIIIVTHNMGQAARVSDDTAFFLSGKLIEKSQTSQLFTKPKDSQTEAYITGRFG